MAQAVVTEGLSIDNPLFRVYAFYCAVLVLKMMFIAVFTGMTRSKTKTFANPEDAAYRQGKVKQDDNVERVRRAHLNDVENIPIFLVVSLVYILTNPSYFLATLLIRAFTLARIIHTVVYAVVVIPQPARALSWSVGFGITGYMALQNLIYFCSCLAAAKLVDKGRVSKVSHGSTVGFKLNSDWLILKICESD
ncbi:hypothetical protein NQ315_007059 [Exocentrus adspersus]|uniref:Microsomal glutathione S-transferase 1 n=1 Tax=Exocentrus adspersus TaxID=1586481 RepID=A0AAV8WD56_9CUCU|nr:hypothetical protein NQ315_007059 [Exocentrus adspersus]